MKICCIQMNVCAANPEANFSHAEALLTKAAKQKSDVILLPELWNTSFAPGRIDANLADEGGARTKALCCSLAQRFGVNIVAGSVLTRKSGVEYNTAYAFDREGNCIAEYDKTHLFSPMGEGEAYAAGNEAVTFALDGVTCGVLTCYDLRFPELSRALALSGAKILFLPAEWPRQRSGQMTTLLCARAIENQVFAALCNGCGSAFGTRFGGRSAIVDPLGKVLAKAGTNERVIFTEIDLEAQENVRKDIPVFIDRRPELYGKISHTGDRQ